MSKLSSSRNKQEKRKAAIETISQEIIPGKINDYEWSLLLEDDEAEDIVCEIVSGIIEASLDVIYAKYLDRQLIPFVVLQASEALIEFVEIESISHDPGEKDIESNIQWSRDTVAESSRIDSWAQGAISKRQPLIMHSDARVEAKTVEIPRGCEEKQISNADQLKADEKTKEVSRDKQTVDQKGMIMVKRKDGKGVKPNKAVSHSEGLGAQGIQVKSTPTQSDKPKMLKVFKPHMGPLGSAHVSAMHENLDAMELKMMREVNESRKRKIQIAKAAEKRIIGSGKIIYDDEGNLLSLPRLFPPQNQGVTDATGSKSPMSNSGPLRSGIPIHWHVLPRSFTGESITNELDSMGSINLTDSNLISKIGMSRKSPIPPELIRLQRVKTLQSTFQNVTDLVELVPGVSISDGERTRVGLKKSQGFRSMLENCWQDLYDVSCTLGSLPTNMNPTLNPQHLIDPNQVEVTHQDEPNGTVVESSTL